MLACKRPFISDINTSFPTSLTDKGMPQKDPCQKQACAIQMCLQANKYLESMCEDVIREMRRCCEIHAANSICCSGFKDSKPTETKRNT